MLSECNNEQPVREAVNDRGLFTAGWFSVREKHYSRLEIYDRFRDPPSSESYVMQIALFLYTLDKSQIFDYNY